MKSRNYKYILAFITLTILATISLQIYWNVKNYGENEKRLINDVQLAFDNSIEHYYAEDAKNNIMSFVGNDSITAPDFVEKAFSDTAFTNSIPGRKQAAEKRTKAFAKAFSLNDSATQKLKGKTSSIHLTKNKSYIDQITSVHVIRGKKAADSISKIKSFTNKIIVSMINDSLELDKIAKAFDKEILRKNIPISYEIQQFKNDTIFQKFELSKNALLPLHTFGNSSILPQSQKLKLLFSNPVVLVLKRSLVEIVLSLLLSLSIIFCLLYLLKTINRQKKIDEIKNDLISNITHEFKTPITTVSTAIEGLRNFNDVNDATKTERYLDISSEQLKKLEIMVEKLLETASIDTDKLVLQKEKTNLIVLLKNLVDKHAMICDSKTLVFNSEMEQLLLTVDIFHLENAISNLIDNAVKYGGNDISVRLSYDKNQIEINVEDNGNGIEKSQREKIFDKFYRIPKGNIHDVKGFGIGLFYSKKIIEKHNGTLELVPTHLTTFKITLPDV